MTATENLQQRSRKHSKDLQQAWQDLSAQESQQALCALTTSYTKMKTPLHNAT